MAYMPKHSPFRKPVITPEEWERVQAEAQAAKELLEDPRFAFFRQYLENAQASILDHFVRNRIKTVQEHLKISNVLTKVFITTKREQEQELAGRYQFIEELLADLKRIAALPQEYRKAHEEGKLIIQENAEA